MSNGNQSLEENGNNEEDMSRAILYVYGHQGMNLLLLLEDQDEADWDLLETLVCYFFICLFFFNGFIKFINTKIHVYLSGRIMAWCSSTARKSLA
jgi:hypothetical protein